MTLLVILGIVALAIGFLLVDWRIDDPAQNWRLDGHNEMAHRRRFDNRP
jgi:hypothetical protein